MSEGRRSFVIYKDSLDVLDDLTNEQAGALFKAIKAYQNGVDMDMDALTKIAMSPFKSQFIRDAEKYKKTVERNKANGIKGGRPKKTKEPTGLNENPKEPSKLNENQKEPTGLNENPKEPEKADSDSDSDSDSDKDKDLLVPTEKPEKKKASAGDRAVAKWMYRLITLSNPGHKAPSIDNWSECIRKIREIDKKSHKEIERVFLWANADSFWSANILSPTKLRSKWDSLSARIIQQNRTENEKSGTNSGGKLSLSERATARRVEFEREQGCLARDAKENDEFLGADGPYLWLQVD